MPGRIYVVVPKTVDSPLPPFKLSMSCGRMAAHVGHAAGLLQEFLPEAEVAGRELIVLSVPGSPELAEVIVKLEAADIGYVRYLDEDKAFEGELLTAIATAPLDEEQRKVFAGLRPWKCKCNE